LVISRGALADRGGKLRERARPDGGARCELRYFRIIVARTRHATTRFRRSGIRARREEKKKAKEDEVDESEVAEAREIFARFLDVGLNVIIIMTRVTRLKDERETGRQKEREGTHVHLRSGRARNYLP